MCVPMKGFSEGFSRVARLLKRLSIKRADLFISFLVTAVALILFNYSDLTKSHDAALGFLHNIELRSLDARFVLRGPRPHDENIVIVGLDENTLQKVGAFPIPRDAYAEMVDQLAKGGAKVVAFDFNFPVPEKNSAVETLRELEKQAPANMTPKLRELERLRDNDAIFAESIKRAGNVVLGHLFLDPERAKSVAEKDVEAYHYILKSRPFPQIQKVSGSEVFDVNRSWVEAKGKVAYGVYPNIESLGNAAKSLGFFDEDADPDGTFRHATLLIYYEEQYFPSLALETVRQAERIKNQDSVAYFGSDGLERIQIGPHNFDTQRDGRALVNFAGPYKTYKHYPMIDVINGTVPLETFQNKIVLFGATAKAIGDLRNIPYGSPDYTGVEVHANIVDNILHANEPGRGFLQRGVTEEFIDIAFILLFGIGLGYWFGKIRPLISAVSVIVALAVFSVIVYFAFTHYGMWLGFVIPAGTLVANYAGITSFRMIFEEREKRRVRQTFARYVSPGVISLIEQDPNKYFQPGGESKEMTILFSDIRRFTEISESLTPNELISLLNEYLGEMTEVLFHHWGTLDKYIGDAIMGFWNSPYPQPDHAIRACSTALDMQARLNELNQKWVADGGRALHSGVGINTGIVKVGNIGSEKRIAWTVIGDNVNLASRLESATKEYHVNVIVAEPTFEQAKESFVFRELDYIRVMGKQQPVRIFELLDFALKRADHEERIELWMRGLELYRRGEWEDAIPAFEEVLKRYPDDGPSILFIERCEEKAREMPAEAWDGVWVMRTK